MSLLQGERRGNRVLLHEKFTSLQSMSLNGWTLAGAPTVDHGLVLNGTTQYATRPDFALVPEIFFSIRFTPTFASDDGVAHSLFWSNTSGAPLQGLAKTATNTLALYLGGALIFNLANASYVGSWLTNQENIIVVSGKTGDTSCWLNGTKIVDGDVSAWTPAVGATIWFGSSPTPSQFFAGMFHEFFYGSGVLTSAEGVRLSTP